MANKLWEKNFEVNAEIERFTVGRDREMDLYLAPYDVLGSMAHITMLESIGLLEADELKQLLAELKNIHAVCERGEFKIEDGMMRLREDYNESIYLPFENLTLRCPKNYDSVLNMHYTERTGISWKVPTKNLGYHTQGINMFLDVDNPYTKYCTYAFWRDKDMDLIPRPEV